MDDRIRGCVDDGHEAVTAVGYVDLLVLRVVIQLVRATLATGVHFRDEGERCEIDDRDVAVVEARKQLVDALGNDDAVCAATRVDRLEVFRFLCCDVEDVYPVGGPVRRIEAVGFLVDHDEIDGRCLAAEWRDEGLRESHHRGVPGDRRQQGRLRRRRWRG